MTLSPNEREKVLRMVADQMLAEIRQGLDLDDLVTLPLPAAAAIIGIGPAQAQRVLKTRPIGKRKRGVSLKNLKAFLNP
jgi:hypothetical protein